MTSTRLTTQNGTPTVVIETEFVIETPPTSTRPEGSLQTDNAASGGHGGVELVKVLVGVVVGAAVLV